MHLELLIFAGGFIIGILGVLVGATAFISVPFFQFMLPAISYAQIIGNMKVGSFFRGIASSMSTWKQRHMKVILETVVPFAFGTIIGTIFTTKISQNYILPIVILAIIISELTPKIAHLINKRTKFIFGLLIGIYAGFIGAGISVLIIALFRTSFPKGEHLVFVKIQSGFLEFIGSTIVVIVNLLYGNILWPIVIYWAAGMFLGGYVGGHVLKKTVNLSKKMQKIYLYILYGITIIPLVTKTFWGK